MSCEPVDQVVDRIAAAALARSGCSVFFANAHTLNTAYERPGFRDVMARADMVLNDGIGVQVAGRLAGLSGLENQNGTDLAPAVCRLGASHGLRLFWLGGQPGHAEEAAAAMARLAPGVEVAGHHHGYFDESELATVCAHIRESRPHIVFVSLGNPLQEEWIDKNLDQLGGAVVMGVGGLVDHMSGHLGRVPEPMRRLGFEWMYRMFQQPWVWRRYVLGIPRFFWRLARVRPAMVEA